MTAPPLCRCCGKPLRKATTTHYVRQAPDAPGWSKDDVVGVFRSKAEVQRATNRQVISLKYHERDGSWGPAGTVWSFNTWDGESYESVWGQGYFHNQNCAVAFANLFAKEGKTTAAYVSALVKQRDQLKAEAAE